ncbi:MAG: CO dehydrogenase/CO-methylating acetyl-CoA synthase complex subunit beta, partial [Candidatus Hydrothermarchaeota archaeon]|nr:CO dehydrogenase/CO-methylating acetyl-CoA synthase complex subunit beta [Candidatus Hydrothermarchaeota archaeon]
MDSNIPVDVGLVYEGERIRKGQMYVDLAGPKSYGAELVQVAPMKAVKDGGVILEGPDLKEMEEGKAYPFGIHIKVAGKKLEEDLEGVFERRVHEFSNFIQGYMHLNSRDIIWCRVSKEATKKGLSLKHVGTALIDLFKAQWPMIEKMQVKLYTDSKEVTSFIEEAKKVYEKRDSRLRGLKDDDVEVFYGCALCQSFAPQHLCTITPSRTSSCGSISWFEGRAAAKIDPKGPIFEIPKGELIDEVKGEYSGPNEATYDKSGGTVSNVYLHSIFDKPHTSCGCFEAIGFYIPEVDGIGVVHRDHRGTTPFGIPFSTMAGQAGGGVQSDGFVGMAIEYLRSPKMLQADGGWNRMVWLPKALKERIADAIPPEVNDKIATEEDATDLESLKEYLKKVEHPVVGRWNG